MGAASLYVLFALCSRGVRAWAPEGHDRIAKVAQALLPELLSSRQVARVRDLMRADLADLAAWDRTMAQQHPETTALHWHRQNPGWACDRPRRAGGETPPETGGNIFSAVAHTIAFHHLGDGSEHIRCDQSTVETGSLFCALAYFFEHFAHDALLREFPQPKMPIGTPKTLTTLQKLPLSELTSSNYLRWLAVLIGDLHQPLHWLQEHSYGQQIRVAFRGQEHTLLSFWERYLPQHLPEIPSPKVLDRQYRDFQPAWWDKMPTELFREWARDMAKTVCSQIYGAMDLNQTDDSRSMGGPFEINEELFQTWLKLADKFTVAAGQRLTYVLVDILEHTRHKLAHKQGRGRHHRQREWTKGLCTNALIGAVVIPLLLLALGWDNRAGAGSLFGSAKDHRIN